MLQPRRRRATGLHNRIYHFGTTDVAEPASLYRRIAEELVREATNAAGAGPLLLPQERQLAARFQVSRSTIRQALALLEEYDLVQRRRGHGTFLTKPAGEALEVWQLRNKRLMVVQFSPVPIRLHVDYYGKIVGGILAEARQQRCTIEVQHRPPLMDAPEQANLLPDLADVGGVILSAAWEDRYLKLFSDRSIPCVCVDYWPHDEHTDAVTVDVEAEAYLTCSHLASCGYRTMGMAAFGRRPRGSDVVRFDPDVWRFIGHLRRAAGQHGLLIRDEWMLTILSADQVAQQAINRFFMLEHRPEAMVCFDREVARRVLEALRKRSIRCPQDIGLLCRDGGRVGDRQLTAVDCQSDSMGRLALQLLLDRVYRRRTVPVRLAVASRLIVGDSTRPLATPAAAKG